VGSLSYQDVQTFAHTDNHAQPFCLRPEQFADEVMSTNRSANRKDNRLKPKPARTSLNIQTDLYERIQAVCKRHFEGRSVSKFVGSVMADVVDMIEHPEAIRAYPRVIEEFDLLQRRRQSPRSAANGITKAESGDEK
jgi:hypothetical protein